MIYAILRRYGFNRDSRLQKHYALIALAHKCTNSRDRTIILNYAARVRRGIQNG